MQRVIAPNKNFMGIRFGVRFIDGISEPVTLTEQQQQWFERNGYNVTGNESHQEEETIPNGLSKNAGQDSQQEPPKPQKLPKPQESKE